MKWRIRVALGVALALTVSPTMPLVAQGTAAEICDPDDRMANLDFTLKDLAGRDVTLSYYEGKVILLNFWATWCGPCKIEIPGFVTMNQKYQDQGLVVLGVSIDDTVAMLEPFAEALKINYPVLIGDGHDDLWEAYPMFGSTTTR